MPIDTGADDLRNGKGQLSHSLVKKGVIKAWHGHLKQGQLNYVATGAITVALYDSRTHSSTYKEPQMKRSTVKLVFKEVGFNIEWEGNGIDEKGIS